MEHAANDIADLVTGIVLLLLIAAAATMVSKRLEKLPLTILLVFVGMAIVVGSFVQAALGRTPTYGLAVIWALVAVAVQNFEATPIVAYLAAAGAIVVMVPTLRAFRG